MLEMSFVVYCDHLDYWPQVQHLVKAYGTFFRQIMIVLNITQSAPREIWPDPLRHKIQILSVPGGLMMGSALNKMLVHLTAERFFLFDPRYSFDNDLIKLLKKLPKVFCARGPLWLSLHQRQEVQSWACRSPEPPSIDQLSGISYRYAPLLPWGALLLTQKDLASIGGFEQQLSFEAMMIDLSWRAQAQTILLAETTELHVRLRSAQPVPLPRGQERKTLYQRYPNLYPCWKAWLRSWSGSSQPDPQPELF